ncbi:MAG TPA: GNAT family N-acetyltransferase [Oscillatoriales cyanobacterium M59_W2019_021]|nr:GNAT family N-acetyltransferase [Oscillatoriales cyanobacterium M59_W2019_021]
MVDRVNNPILKYLENCTIRLRPTNNEDCGLLWEWANDPEVRAASFNSEPIPWEAHTNWFKKKLQDPNSYIFIAIDLHDRPIGQVRFDRNDEDAVISINIAPNKKGLGFGFSTLIKGLDFVFSETAIQKVHAFIKLDNHASIRIFEKASFKKLGIKIVKNSSALHYLKQKDLDC